MQAQIVCKITVRPCLQGIHSIQMNCSSHACLHTAVIPGGHDFDTSLEYTARQEGGGDREERGGGREAGGGEERKKKRGERKNNLVYFFVCLILGPTLHHTLLFMC